MSQEKIHVVTDLPTPSRLAKLPVKKVAVAAVAVVAVYLAGKYVKDHSDVEIVDDGSSTTT
jgi:hypothetical protein